MTTERRYAPLKRGFFPENDYDVSGDWHFTGTVTLDAPVGVFTPVDHAHSTDEITSGTFADALIAESNVTQHQLALSIAYSQLTGVPSVSAVDWDDVTGKPTTFTPSAHFHDFTTDLIGLATYAQLQDAAAVSVLGRASNSVGVLDEIVAGANDRLLTRVSDAVAFTQLTAGMFPALVVPDAALSANVPLLNANNTFTGGQQTLSGAASFLHLNSTSSAANNRLWRIAASTTDQLIFALLDDAITTQAIFLTVERTANTVDSIALAATAITLNGVAATDFARLSQANTFTAFNTFSVGDDFANFSASSTTGKIKFHGYHSSFAGGFIQVRNAADTANFPLQINSSTFAVDANTTIALTGTAITLNGVAATDFARLSQSNTFSGTNQIIQTAVTATLGLKSTGSPVDARNWRISVTNDGTMSLRAINDAESAGYDFLVATRSGMTVATLALAATAITLNGVASSDFARLSQSNVFTDSYAIDTGPIVLSAAIPSIQFTQTGAATDNKKWLLLATGEQFRGLLASDSGGTTDWLTIDRTNNTADTIILTSTTVSLLAATLLVTGSNAHLKLLDTGSAGGVYLELRDAGEVSMGFVGAQTTANYIITGADQAVCIRSDAASRILFSVDSGATALVTMTPTAIVSDASNAGSFKTIARNASSATNAYTSWNLYNDQNSGTRALEIDYSSSAYSGALISGSIAPTGEQGAIGTVGAYPLSLYTSNTAALVIDAAGTVGLTPSTTTRAPFKIPHGTAPSAPVDGDMWTTTAGLYVRINGATVGPLS